MNNEPEVAEENQNQMITPGGTIEQAKEQFEQYQELREELATDDDIVNIKGKEHPTKSFVRKVSRFFNLSCELISDEPVEVDEEIVAWTVIARASHKNTGQFQEADGSCEMSEKTGDGKTIHNIRAHAVTRAKNRAILDLVGFGEVSAEEINQNSSPGNKSKQSHDEYTIPFGDAQGTPITEAETEELEWIKPKLNIDHEKYGERNKKLKQAIEEELQSQQIISEEQEAEIFKLADQHGINQDLIEKLAESIFGDFDQITRKQANKFIDKLENSDSNKIEEAIEENVNDQVVDIEDEPEEQEGKEEGSEESEETDEDDLTPPGERDDPGF